MLASTFDNFTQHLQRADIAKRLPVISSEVGDTWVVGDRDRNESLRRQSTGTAKNTCTITYTELRSERKVGGKVVAIGDLLGYHVQTIAAIVHHAQALLHHVHCPPHGVLHSIGVHAHSTVESTVSRCRRTVDPAGTCANHDDVL